MQLHEDHIARAIKALEYYRDRVAGSEYMYDRYEETVAALKAYQDQYSTED